MLLWLFLSIAAGSPSGIPEKLRLYQNVTGIDDEKLINILHNSLQRKHVRHQRQYDNALPKFRYTGSAESGGVWGNGGIPVIWDTEKLNVDSVINGGVFLCMRPGFYHFSAALSADATDKSVGVYINHNSINKVYAR